MEQLNKIKAAPKWTCDSDNNCAEYRQFKKGKWVTTPSNKVNENKPYLKIALEGSAHMYAESDIECKLIVLGSFLPPNMIKSLHSNWQY
ncbi:hypothetical protein HA050_18475 [Iodobacter sp. HSC-16F04]|uniref:Uncharacterized protein n=1 Tax=Iodobacter violaceini TaxID=3044271 RepID=A0ABX0L3R7_9NEIS|nr:hypothetical protein [Iodobacter violacea]NHQ88096.1 hypothetical protein [Iodobacter violacea]